jgi:hypothetical protein
MTSSIRPAALLSALVLLAGCATGFDPHAPKTVSARAEGGEVRVDHGQRLRIPLAGEWRRVEPPVMRVVLEGPPREDAMLFTPVRTGQETLRFESGQRSVSYDITVR